MNKYQQFWIMSNVMIGICATGYILQNGKVSVTYDLIDEDGLYNNYNDFVDSLLDECYVVFDLPSQ